MKKIFFVFIFGFLIVPAGVDAQDNGVKEKARELYLHGNILYQQGKYKAAEEEFQKALDILGQKEKVESKVAVVVEASERLEYTIGPEDILQVAVWQNPDLTQDAIVRPDGKISFPLIGDVQAVGLTINQLDLEMTERLKDFVKYPEVSIAIKKIGGRKVIVLGEVKAPGVYAVTGSQRILEAIGLAGGFSKDAVPSSVVLIRGGFAKPKPQRLNLSRTLTLGDMAGNVTLNPEDIVFVPKKFIADINYFLQQIIEPLSRGALASQTFGAFSAVNSATQ